MKKLILKQIYKLLILKRVLLFDSTQYVIVNLKAGKYKYEIESEVVNNKYTVLTYGYFNEVN